MGAPPPANPTGLVFELRERDPGELVAHIAGALGAALADYERDPAAARRALRALANVVNQEMRAARFRQAHDYLDAWAAAGPDRTFTADVAPEPGPGRAWRADVLLEGAGLRRVTRVARTRVAALEKALTAAESAVRDRALAPR